jgi:hypothetical protein
MSIKAYTTEDILPDNQNIIVSNGTEIRKGTVKATIENIKLLNECFKQPFTKERNTNIKAIMRIMEELIEALHLVGLFEFFQPLEWLQDSKNKGRIMVALLYLSMHKEQLDEKIRLRVYELKKNFEPEQLDLLSVLHI